MAPLGAAHPSPHPLLFVCRDRSAAPQGEQAPAQAEGDAARGGHPGQNGFTDSPCKNDQPGYDVYNYHQLPDSSPL